MIWLYALYALAIIAYLVGGFFFIKYKLWRSPFWLIRMKLVCQPIDNSHGGTFKTYQEFFKSPVADGMAIFWFFLWPIVATIHVLGIIFFSYVWLIGLLLSLVFKYFITWFGKKVKSLAGINGA